MGQDPSLHWHSRFELMEAVVCAGVWSRPSVNESTCPPGSKKHPEYPLNVHVHCVMDFYQIANEET